MLNQLEKNSLSNTVVSTAILIKVLTLRCFKKYGFEITPEQFIILDTIAKNEKIYQRQIGELIGKDRANVNRLINILEKQGLLERSIDSNGRQINRIKITQKGRELRDRIYPIITKIRASYLNNIDYEELLKCHQILNKIKENISKSTKLKT